MGNCLNQQLEGEEYIRKIFSDIKVRELSYKDLHNWVQTNLIKMTYDEVKKEVNDNSKRQFKENTNENDFLNLVLNSLKYENNEFIPYVKYLEFEDIYMIDKINRLYTFQHGLLNTFYWKHFEYNAYYLELILLSFLIDSNVDKVNIFFNVCSSIKRLFTYEDFKLYFFSYLYNNLNLSTLSIMNHIKPGTMLYYSFEYLILDYYSDSNVISYLERVLEQFEKKTFTENKESKREYVMKQEDFIEIFAEREQVFSFPAIRDDFNLIFT